MSKHPNLNLIWTHNFLHGLPDSRSRGELQSMLLQALWSTRQAPSCSRSSGVQLGSKSGQEVIPDCICRRAVVLRVSVRSLRAKPILHALISRHQTAKRTPSINCTASESIHGIIKRSTDEEQHQLSAVEQ